jgi:hypothetical protein
MVKDDACYKWTTTTSKSHYCSLVNHDVRVRYIVGMLTTEIKKFLFYLYKDVIRVVASRLLLTIDGLLFPQTKSIARNGLEWGKPFLTSWFCTVFH